MICVGEDEYRERAANRKIPFHGMLGVLLLSISKGGNLK